MTAARRFGEQSAEIELRDNSIQWQLLSLASFGFSRPSRKQESIRDSKVPYIYIRGVRKIFPRIAGIQSYHVGKVVVQPNFRELSIASRERVTRDKFRTKELLHPERRFESAQGRVGSMKLREAIRSFDPITMAAGRVGPLSFDLQWHGVRRPREVYTEGI